MSGTENVYDTNTQSTSQRTTADAGDVATATAKYDPRTESKGQGDGAPKREQFDAGLPGDAAYAKAVRRYQKLKSDGQVKAFGDMKND